MKINIVDYNYDAIKYFISVAYHGSLSRAAHSLEISQSALSQSMKNLEQSLKVKLFNRNTRGIILTKEGQILYEIAKVGNEYFQDAIIKTLRINQSKSLKTFKVTASHSILNSYVIPVMKKMICQYKDVNFEIGPYVKQSEIVNKLQSGQIDLIIDKIDLEFILKEIVLQKIAEHNYYFVYDPNYFNFKDDVNIEDLKDYTIILKSRTGRNDNSWIKTSCRQVITCRNDESVLDLVKQGIGIGLYPKELVKKEELKILNLKDYIPTKRIVAAFYLETNNIAKDFVNELIQLLN